MVEYQIPQNYSTIRIILPPKKAGPFHTWKRTFWPNQPNLKWSSLLFWGCFFRELSSGSYKITFGEMFFWYLSIKNAWSGLKSKSQEESRGLVTQAFSIFRHFRLSSKQINFRLFWSIEPSKVSLEMKGDIIQLMSSRSTLRRSLTLKA